MTALSAGMQGKGSNPALKKAWVPPHPQCTAMGASTPTTYGNGCLHTHNVRQWVPPHPQCTAMGASTPTTYGTQGADFAPLQSTGASTPTTYGTQGADFAPLQSTGASTPTMHKSSTARAWVCSHPQCSEGLHLFVSYVYSSKHTNFGDQGYQSFTDRVTEFHSITS